MLEEESFIAKVTSDNCRVQFDVSDMLKLSFRCSLRMHFKHNGTFGDFFKLLVEWSVRALLWPKIKKFGVRLEPNIEGELDLFNLGAVSFEPRELRKSKGLGSARNI